MKEKTLSLNLEGKKEVVAEIATEVAKIDAANVFTTH